MKKGIHDIDDDDDDTEGIVVVEADIFEDAADTELARLSGIVCCDG